MRNRSSFTGAKSPSNSIGLAAIERASDSRWQREHTPAKTSARALVRPPARCARSLSVYLSPIDLIRGTIARSPRNHQSTSPLARSICQRLGPAAFPKSRRPWWSYSGNARPIDPPRAPVAFLATVKSWPARATAAKCANKCFTCVSLVVRDVLWTGLPAEVCMRRGYEQSHDFFHRSSNSGSPSVALSRSFLARFSAWSAPTSLFSCSSSDDALLPLLYPLFWCEIITAYAPSK